MRSNVMFIMVVFVFIAICSSIKDNDASAGGDSVNERLVERIKLLEKRVVALEKDISRRFNDGNMRFEQTRADIRELRGITNKDLEAIRREVSVIHDQQTDLMVELSLLPKNRDALSTKTK